MTDHPQTTQTVKEEMYIHQEQPVTVETVIQTFAKLQSDKKEARARVSEIENLMERVAQALAADQPIPAQWAKELGILDDYAHAWYRDVDHQPYLQARKQFFANVLRAHPAFRIVAGLPEGGPIMPWNVELTLGENDPVRVSISPECEPDAACAVLRRLADALEKDGPKLHEECVTQQARLGPEDPCDSDHMVED